MHYNTLAKSVISIQCFGSRVMFHLSMYCCYCFLEYWNWGQDQEKCKTNNILQSEEKLCGMFSSARRQLLNTAVNNQMSFGCNQVPNVIAQNCQHFKVFGKVLYLWPLVLNIWQCFLFSGRSETQSESVVCQYNGPFSVQGVVPHSEGIIDEGPGQT